MPNQVGEAAEALAGASATAHSAAETVLMSSPDKVLKPSTSAGLYDGIGGAGDEGEDGGSSAAVHMPPEPAASPELPPAAQQQDDPSEAPHAAMGLLHDDDRFLSLATGEAQADALDVGAPAQRRPDQAPGAPPAPNGLPPQQPAAERMHADGDAAAPGHAGAAAAPGAESAAGQEPRHEGRMVALTEALQHRASSTLATVGSSEEATVAGSDMSTTVHEAAEGAAAPENSSSAHEDGSGKDAPRHLPATSSDADPFHETDVGLKVVPAGQAQVRALYIRYTIYMYISPC